jgi:hypothetical protein
MSDLAQELAKLYPRHPKGWWTETSLPPSRWPAPPILNPPLTATGPKPAARNPFTFKAPLPLQQPRVEQQHHGAPAISGAGVLTAKVWKKKRQKGTGSLWQRNPWLVSVEYRDDAGKRKQRRGSAPTRDAALVLLEQLTAEVR